MSQGVVIEDVQCRKVKKNGVVGVFISEGIYFKQIVEEFNQGVDCEVAGVKLSIYNFVVISVYRSQKGNVNSYLNNLNL